MTDPYDTPLKVFILHPGVMSVEIPRNSFVLSGAVTSLPASRKTKGSGDESRDDGGDDSDASSPSQKRPNGDMRSSKQRPSRQAAKTRANGEKCLHPTYLETSLLLCDESVSYISPLFVSQTLCPV